MLKGKQVVSLVKRFSNKFFQCLQSSSPESPRICNCLLLTIAINAKYQMPLNTLVPNI